MIDVEGRIAYVGKDRRFRGQEYVWSQGVWLHLDGCPVLVGMRSEPSECECGARALKKPRGKR